MTPQVTVQWTYPGTDEQGFLLERSSDSASTWPLQWGLPSTVTSYIDTAVTYNSMYWYKVAASNPNGTGSFSPPVRAFIQAPNPQVFLWQTGSSSILFWNYIGAGPMEVSRSTNGGVTWPVTSLVQPTSASTYYYVDNSTSVGTSYTFRIRERTITDEPSYTSPTKTILPYSTTTSLAFGGDSGFEVGAYIPWEVHTASLLNINDTARGHFSVSRWVLGGDNGYFSPTFHNGYQGQCFQLLGPSESIWAIVGNHDQSDMGGANAFKHYFGYPFVQYSWKQGCVEGIGITTTYETDTTYTTGNTNWLFLSNSLSNSLNDPSVAWRFVIVHAPVLSSLFVHPGNPTLQAIPWQQWGVDAVFSGHNHTVERLESGSVAFIIDGALSNEKSPYYLRGTPNTYSRFINGDADDGNGPYCGGYVYTLIQATPQYLSMSFYSGSTKVHDTGSTSIPNAHMDGFSFIKLKSP